MKTLLGFALFALLALGTVALAGPPASGQAAEPGECVQSGIGTLMSLDKLVDAAQQDVNYAQFDQTGTGDIDLELGNEYYAPLGAIVKLHVTNPGLFSWC